MYGTADFNQGYTDGFNGTKTCMEGRAQFDSQVRKSDYTQGHGAGRSAKTLQEWSKLTPSQAKVRAERETKQAILREYGYTDDSIEALDNINLPIGPRFPSEG